MLSVLAFVDNLKLKLTHCLKLKLSININLALLNEILQM